MNLDRMTITGADDSITPEQLLVLTAEYPFAEWGILVSARSMGSPRFPSAKWIATLQGLAALGKRDGRNTPKLSLHLCGRWLRDLLVGNVSFDTGLLSFFDRVQLNFHAEELTVQPEAFSKAIDTFDFKSRQVIFQIDGRMGAELLHHARTTVQDGDFVPLFDLSHGAGVVPDKWPSPLPLARGLYHGYAGGLGPDNLAEQLPLIGAAAGETRVWIDMETKVRSDNDRKFDLAKVRRCLEICEPFVRKATP